MTSKLTSLEQWKLGRCKILFGSMSSITALKQAIEAESILKQMQVGDIAYGRYLEERNQLFNYALLLEKNGE